MHSHVLFTFSRSALSTSLTHSNSLNIITSPKLTLTLLIQHLLCEAQDDAALRTGVQLHAGALRQGADGHPAPQLVQGVHQQCQVVLPEPIEPVMRLGVHTPTAPDCRTSLESGFIISGLKWKKYLVTVGLASRHISPHY